MADVPRVISSKKPSCGVKLPICSICGELVALENSKTDEDVIAIHEECYVLKIGLKAATMPFES